MMRNELLLGPWREIASPANEVTMESQINLIKAHVDGFHLDFDLTLAYCANVAC